MTHDEFGLVLHLCMRESEKKKKKDASMSDQMEACCKDNITHL